MEYDVPFSEPVDDECCVGLEWDMEREMNQDWDWDHNWQVEYEIEKRGE